MQSCGRALWLFSCTIVYNEIVYKAHLKASIDDENTERRSKASCIFRAIQIYSVL